MSLWTCQRVTDGVRCRFQNPGRKRKCMMCGKPRPARQRPAHQQGTESMSKTCTRCGEMQPIDNFYFVSRKLGTRRGQCKACMSEIKQAQKDPDWRPQCPKCGQERDRLGPGRRLCHACFDLVYDAEQRRPSGSHRCQLKPCRACGVKRLRDDHYPGSSLCPVCRSVPQHRRKRLKDFNLTPREYLELADAQKYRCAACQRKPKTTLHVDHSHSEPLIVRGLLCDRCNTILALARDTQNVLVAAAVYLDAPIAQRLFPGRVASEAANRTGEYRPLKRFKLEKGARVAQEMA